MNYKTSADTDQIFMNGLVKFMNSSWMFMNWWTCQF